VFGAISYSGIFDRLAKQVMHIVLVLAKMVFGAIPGRPIGFSRERRLFRCCQEVCDKIAVKLAPTDNLDKAFGPTSTGVLLGVCYNAMDWVWFLKEDKLSIILNMLQGAMKVEKMTRMRIKLLMVDIRCIVLTSKFYHTNLIMDSHQLDGGMKGMVRVSDWARSELAWWELHEHERLCQFGLH
jgi:hypothetical protein